MTNINEEYDVIGFNDLDNTYKKKVVKEKTNSALTKTYHCMEKISESFANQIGFNNSNYQYAIDAIELRKFHKYIKISLAKEKEIGSYETQI